MSSMPEPQDVPYDLTQELAAKFSRHDPAVLVVAAFALTSYRWTAVSDVTIAVPDRLIRLKVDDQQLVDDFLIAVRESSIAQDGPADFAIQSGQTDLRTGVISFITPVPDAACGFIADVATAVKELTSFAGSMENVRCIAPERRKILDSLAGAEVPATDIETLFKVQVGLRSHEVAVRDARTVLTYDQLAQAAEQYAGVLWRVGVREGDTVLVANRRSVGEVVALLAIIYLGAAYAGIDEDAPQARTVRIVTKLAPAAAIVDIGKAEDPALAGLVCVDSWQPGQHAQIDPQPSFQRPHSHGPSRAAYVAFTSGSTGEPKGVVVPNQGVARLALTTELQMRQGDRILRMAPLAFDASTYEIWVTLLNGATLEVFPSKLPSISELAAFLADRKVSVAWLTASLFRLVAKSRPQAFAGLRWLVTGGEVVPPETVARMLELHPGLAITNGYGPTENTTFTTTHTVQSSAEVQGALPIGKPIAGTKVLILDHKAHVVPPCGVGELYAGGLGLANGYLDDELETSLRFGQFSPDVDERLYRTGDLVRLDPFGNLLFLGRRDKQVKLNGHRIEIDEIRAALSRHPDVRDAVIVLAHSAERAPQLVAVFSVQSGTEADPRVMYAFLSRILPSYGLPALWLVVDEIPLTCNGKVDERAVLESAMPLTRFSKGDRDVLVAR
jgi:amino acid adenylation domain-containing protein